MAQPENSNNNLAIPKKKLPRFLKFLATLRSLFVFCYTAPFICALVVSYNYMQVVPVAMLIDYLTDSWKNKNLRKAAILTNLQDFLSCYFEVVLSQMSQAFTGRFTMITFCTAVSTTGLMLLWISATSTKELHMVYIAIFLLPLGKAGQTLLQDFLVDQLVEKVRVERGNLDNIAIIINIWWCSAMVIGSVLAVCVSSYLIHTQSGNFKFAALLMGATGLFFYCGCAHHSPKTYENLPTESDLGKISRIYHVALKKLKSRYPTSAISYYWKNYKQNHMYNHGEDLRLLPRVPRILGWLDKAAIVKEQSTDSDPSPRRQEMKGDLCMVKEVREVKSLAPLMLLGSTLFASSLVVASANTFFVEQVSNLNLSTEQEKDRANRAIPLLFVAKSIMRDVSPFICMLISFAFEKLRKSQVTNRFNRAIVATIIRIGVGMVCALICCIVAWRVELHRLSVIEKGSISASVFLPQFLLVGITEGLVDSGLTILFLGIASKSMWSFENSFRQMVIGTGKLFTIPFVLICSGWIKKTVNTSHLEKYYVMLAILNFVLLLAFVYVAFSIRYAYKGECPNDEEIEMEQQWEHAHEQDSGSIWDRIKFGISGWINGGGGHRG